MSVDKALASGAFKTDILAKCRGGHMVELYGLNIHGEDRKVYKVFSDAGVFLFKTTTYLTSNKAVDRKVSGECSVARQYGVGEEEEHVAGFAKVVDQDKGSDEVFCKTSFETLHEFGADSLQSKLTTMSTTERINAMKKLLIPMAIMEEKEVVHSDLRPESIIVRGERCLIADFGAKLDFGSEGRANSVADAAVCKMLGEMSAYAPPEVLRGNRSHPAKIDIYNWGMCLYQVVKDLTCDELRAKTSMRKCAEGHEEFLQEIKNIDLADKGVSKELEDWTRDALLKALHFNPQERATFGVLKKEANLDGLIQRAERLRHKEAVSSMSYLTYKLLGNEIDELKQCVSSLKADNEEKSMISAEC